MGLTSSDTITTALAQYNDNLAWDNDPSKAALALEAVRWLLVNRPVASTKGGTSLNYDTLAEEKKKLEAFVDSSTASTSRRRCSFTRGRAL